MSTFVSFRIVSPLHRSAPQHLAVVTYRIAIASLSTAAPRHRNVSHRHRIAQHRSTSPS